MSYYYLDKYEAATGDRKAVVYCGGGTNIKTYYQAIEGDYYAEKAISLINFLNGGDGAFPPRHLIEEGAFPDLMEYGEGIERRLKGLESAAESINEIIGALEEAKAGYWEGWDSVEDIAKSIWLELYSIGCFRDYKYAEQTHGKIRERS